MENQERLIFFKNRIKEKLESIKDDIPPVRYKLWVASVDACDSYDELREMAELDMQLDMFEYTKSHINPKLEKLNMEMEVIREAKSAIITKDSTIKVKDLPPPDDYTLEEMVEDLDDPEIDAAMAALLMKRLETEPLEESYREDILNSLDSDEDDDFNTELDDLVPDDEEEEQEPKSENTESNLFDDFADIETDVVKSIREPSDKEDDDGIEDLSDDELGEGLGDESEDTEDTEDSEDDELGDLSDLEEGSDNSEDSEDDIFDIDTSDIDEEEDDEDKDSDDPFNIDDTSDFGDIEDGEEDTEDSDDDSDDIFADTNDADLDFGDIVTEDEEESDDEIFESEENSDDGIDNLGDGDFGDLETEEDDPFTSLGDEASFDDLVYAADLLGDDTEESGDTEDDDFGELDELGDSDDSEDSEDSEDTDNLDDDDAFGDLVEDDEKNENSDDDIFEDIEEDDIGIADDSDDFFEEKGETTEKKEVKQSKEAEDKQRKISSTSVFVNGTANGDKTQKMFNSIFKLSSAFTRSSIKMTKTAKTKVKEVGKSEFFELS